MKTTLIALLVSFASVVSAAPAEWTTLSQNFSGTTGQSCKLEIKSLIVVPTNLANIEDGAIEKLNETLSVATNTLIASFNEAVRMKPNCQKSKVQGALSASLETKLVFKNNTWSTWEQTTSGYLGGAHGFAAVDRYVIASNGDMVTFDTVLSVSRQQFIRTVEAKVKAAGRYVEYFFNSWAESDTAILELNYAADEKGISIFFNSYEINAYSEGPTEINYTWAELRPLLKSNSVFSQYLVNLRR